MRSLRPFGLASALAALFSLPAGASAQAVKAENLRVDSRIRVQQIGGETGTGLFLGLLGDTLLYEEATFLPADAWKPSGVTHAIVKVPIAAIQRLDVRSPDERIVIDRCAGILRGAWCGVKIAGDAVNDDHSNDPYEGIAEGVATIGLTVGGAVVGLIKSVNRHASKDTDFGWLWVSLPPATQK